MEWSAVEEVELFRFKGDCFREATVVRGEVIYFGRNNRNVTYVLKQEEKKLKLCYKFDGVEYQRGSSDSSFCVFS